MEDGDNKLHTSAVYREGARYMKAQPSKAGMQASAKQGSINVVSSTPRGRKEVVVRARFED